MTHAEIGFGLAYAFASTLMLRGALACRKRGSRETWAWLSLALLLAFLAMLRFTALHEVMLAALRQVAQQEGWYSQRKILQGAVLELLLGAAVLALALFAIGVRYLRAAILTAATSVALLGMLSLARAMSFHRLDDILQWDVGSLNLAQYEELVLLLFAAGAALIAGTKKGAVDNDRAPELSQAEEA